MKYLIYICLSSAIFLNFFGCNKTSNDQNVSHSTATSKNNSELLNRPLKFTYFAFCQMSCERIPTKMVRQVIKDGKVKTSNKWVNTKPCPLFLVTGNVNGKEVQVVLASCEGTTKVVRVFGAKRDKCKCKSQQETT